jgi:hypothetical protein
MKQQKTTWRQLEKQTGISIIILKARPINQKVETAKGRAIQI